MLIVQQIAGYFLIGILFVLLLAVLYLLFGLLLRKKVSLARQTVFFLLGVCVTVICAATFFELTLSRLLAGQSPFVEYHALNLIPFRFLTESWGMGVKQQISQCVGNILMFVPLGFVLPIAVKKTRNFATTTFCLMGFSLGIEFIQYFIGRISDIDDLLLNTLGGMIGYALFYVFSKKFGKTRVWCSLCGKVAASEKA